MDADVEEPFKCEVCGKSFAKSPHLGTHKWRQHKIQRNHGKKSKGFSCPVCAKVIKGYTASALKKHMESHVVTEKLNKCSECGKWYKDAKNLKAHHLTVHAEGQERFKCEICSKDYATVRCLEEHVIDAHVVDKEFECNICQKLFLTELNLEQHRKKVHDKKFTCDVCPTFYSAKKSLLKHLRRSHLRTQFCLLCQKSFSGEEEYQQHMDVDGSAGQDPLPCPDPVCPLVFGTPCVADQHWSEVHKPAVGDSTVAQKTAEEEVRFHCDLCEKRFTTQRHLRSHERHVHRGAVWKCQVCEKTFEQKCHLSVHTRHKHITERKYKCEICVKLFRTQEGLKLHIKIHDPDKPFKCSKCPKSYTARRFLRIHLMNAHGEGEKKYKCPHCPMRFSSNYHLEKNHIPTHFDERPFPCESCSLSFKTKGSMRTHMRSTCRHRRAFEINKIIKSERKGLRKEDLD